MLTPSSATPYRMGFTDGFTGRFSGASLAWSDDLMPSVEETVNPSIKYRSAHQPDDPLATLLALVGAPEDVKFKVERQLAACTTAHLYPCRRQHPLFLGALLIQVLQRDAAAAEAVRQRHPTYASAADVVADAAGIRVDVLTSSVMNAVTAPVQGYEHALWEHCQEWMYQLPDEVANQIPRYCNLLSKFNLDILPHTVALVLRLMLEKQKLTAQNFRRLEYNYNLLHNTLRGVHEVLVTLLQV